MSIAGLWQQPALAFASQWKLLGHAPFLSIPFTNSCNPSPSKLVIFDILGSLPGDLNGIFLLSRLTQSILPESCILDLVVGFGTFQRGTPNGNIKLNAAE